MQWLFGALITHLATGPSLAARQNPPDPTASQIVERYITARGAGIEAVGYHIAPPDGNRRR